MNLVHVGDAHVEQDLLLFGVLEGRLVTPNTDVSPDHVRCNDQIHHTTNTRHHHTATTTHNQNDHDVNDDNNPYTHTDTDTHTHSLTRTHTHAHTLAHAHLFRLRLRVVTITIRFVTVCAAKESRLVNVLFRRPSPTVPVWFAWLSTAAAALRTPAAIDLRPAWWKTCIFVRWMVDKPHIALTHETVADWAVVCDTHQQWHAVSGQTTTLTD